MVPQVTPLQHALMDGVDRVLPNIRGFVLTQIKDGPLPQVVIRSPGKPTEPENQTVLAVWTYGLGRTAVLTTDAGARWADSWSDWSDYDKFFSQLVRWTMRPTGDTGKFSIATTVQDGEVEVVVNALKDDDTFLDFLDMQANVSDMDVDAEGKTKTSSDQLDMRQTAPGRYVGRFQADAAGNYFVTVIPEPGAAPLTVGVSVPYSDEFRVRDTNMALIESLARTQPKGGTPGEVTVPLEEQPTEELVDANAFRGGLPLARSIKDAWPWFMLAACCLFLADVFVRRVAVNFNWITTAMKKLRGQSTEKDAKVTARLDALRKNKEALGDSLEKRRASVRFEPTAEHEGGEDVEIGVSGGGAQKESASGKAGGADATKTAGPSYTERLLAAKKKARKD